MKKKTLEKLIEEDWEYDSSDYELEWITEEPPLDLEDLNWEDLENVIISKDLPRDFRFRDHAIIHDDEEDKNNETMLAEKLVQPYGT
jgi:hypothetical protein